MELSAGDLIILESISVFGGWARGIKLNCRIWEDYNESERCVALGRVKYEFFRLAFCCHLDKWTKVTVPITQRD